MLTITPQAAKPSQSASLRWQIVDHAAFNYDVLIDPELLDVLLTLSSPLAAVDKAVRNMKGNEFVLGFHHFVGGA